MKEINNYADLVMNILNVRRNETICCLVGFGIGVGCCILYRLISNFLIPSSTKTKSNSKHDSKTLISSNIKNIKQEYIRKTKCGYDDYIRNNNSDEMTWSEMSSSLSTVNLLHDSYHSNCLTGDSGVDCSEISNRNHQCYNNTIDYDDDNEILLRKYDSDTAINHHDTQVATESHVMSYISTEKGLEHALEQTSRFYTDLEHIAIDLGTLTKRYSQSQTSLLKTNHRTIDALDWDWHDDIQSPVIQSPKTLNRKQQYYISSLNRSNNKNKVRRRLNISMNQTDYHESDNNNRFIDYTTSPLRRKHSSVYFDSSDNTSDEENLGDQTLQTTF